MSIPKYLMVLANNKGPASVNVGGMALPVKIMDIEHESKFGESDTTTFKCLVVNEDQILYPSCEVNYSGLAASEILRELADRHIKSHTNRPHGAPKLSHSHVNPFEIVDVIFNKPATIVFWADGTKTVVKCQEGDAYSKETGLAMAIAKKVLGNKGNFNEVFKKYIPEYVKGEVADEMPEV